MTKVDLFIGWGMLFITISLLNVWTLADFPANLIGLLAILPILYFWNFNKTEKKEVEE